MEIAAFFLFDMFKIQRQILSRWQFLVLTVQKIGYCLVRKAICFHRVPIGKLEISATVKIK